MARDKNYRPSAFSDNPLVVTPLEHWSWDRRSKRRGKRVQSAIEKAMRRVVERAVLEEL